MFLDADRREQARDSRSRSAWASRRWSPGSAEPEARYEASRCLSCGNCFECDNCYAACPEQAIVKLGKGRFYRFDYDLCTGCAVCFEQCPCHAIEMSPEPAAATPTAASRQCRCEVQSPRVRGVTSRQERYA